MALVKREEIFDFCVSNKFHDMALFVIAESKLLKPIPDISIKSIEEF